MIEDGLESNSRLVENFNQMRKKESKDKFELSSPKKSSKLSVFTNNSFFPSQNKEKL